MSEPTKPKRDPFYRFLVSFGIVGTALNGVGYLVLNAKPQLILFTISIIVAMIGFYAWIRDVEKRIDEVKP